MRVPVTPFDESIGIDRDDALDPSRTGIYAAAIPIAAFLCLGLWILAIWKFIELVTGG